MMELIDYVIELTNEYMESMSKDVRKKYGQLFTGKETALVMASLFDLPSSCNSISILDPGSRELDVPVQQQPQKEHRLLLGKHCKLLFTQEVSVLFFVLIYIIYAVFHFQSINMYYKLSRSRISSK